MELSDKQFMAILNNLMEDPGEDILDESYQEWKDAGYPDDWEDDEGEEE